MNITNGLGFVEELSDQEVAAVEARMRPNCYSMAGFLGVDESLRKVSREDQEALAKRGLSYAQVAERLEELREEARQAFWKPALSLCSPLDPECESVLKQAKAPKFEFKIRQTRGFQFCPFKTLFAEEGVCGRGSADYFVKNIKTGEELMFSDLHIHLIHDHHFFEGKETSYRLDPERACRILEIEAKT